MKRKVTIEQLDWFCKMLDTAKKALRSKYTEKESRQIETAFANDPAEIIAIAARDIQNAMKLSKDAKALRAGKGGS